MKKSKLKNTIATVAYRTPRAAKARRKKFIAAVVGTKRLQDAAVAAGYPPSTAPSIASKLMNEPAVAEAVERRREEVCRKLGITRERVLIEYRRLAFADIGDVLSWSDAGVSLRDSDGLDPEVRAAVAEVTQTTTKDGGSMRVKMHDKKAALDALAKHLRILSDAPDPVDHDLNRVIRLTLVDDTTPTEVTPQEAAEDGEK